MPCFLVFSALFTLARADEPQPAPTQAAETVQAVTQVKPAPEESAAVRPASRATSSDKTSETAAVTEARIKQMRGRGYKPEMRNGTLVFCRSEGQIGTHFEQTHCNTMDELNRAELTGKEYVNHIQQQGSPTPFKGP